jgi:putative hemolysin
VSILLEQSWRLLLMAGLLCCSAFCSASETAFFNQSRRQLEQFRLSGNPLQMLVARLMESPERLLTTLLLSNMTVNTLFFSLSSVLSLELARSLNAAAGAVSAVLEFLILVLLGEMLPKAVAYSNARRICLLAAPVWFPLMRILRPLLRIFDGLAIRPALRLILGPRPSRRPSGPLTPQTLKRLLEPSIEQGWLTESQNRLMTEVLQLGLLKVRNIMRPRVDLLFCQVHESPAVIQARMIERKQTRIAVYEKSVDNVLGILSLRDLVLYPQTHIRAALQTVGYVPEHAPAEILFDIFSSPSTDLALVVDEYGGITGMVSREILIDELAGGDQPSPSVAPIKQIGPMQYRLAGYLPIHEWAGVFGIDPRDFRGSTVSGLILQQLGKIPRPGDSILLDNLRLTIERMDRHRIRTVILQVEPISPQEGTA